MSARPTSLPRIRVAALIEEAGRVLLVRHLKEGRSYWMLPGGGVRHGESLHDALVRELKEELRLDIRPGPLLLVHDSIPPDQRRHIVNLYFLGEIVRGAPEVGGDPRVVEARFVQIDAVQDLPFLPDIFPELRARLGGDTPAYLGSHWRE